MRMRWKAAACSTLWRAFIAVLTLVLATAANADEPAKIPPADPAALAAGIPEGQTADALLVMACAALALLMIPAVGLFYAGMVRRKNVLSAFQQTFILLGVMPLQWVLVGYSLSFGPDLFAGLCGGWQWFGLQGVGLEPSAELAPRVPHQLFMIFEMLVAVFAGGTHFGGDRRADEVCVVRGFHPALDDLGLRPGCTLGVEPRRLDQADRRARLRRRAGGPSDFGPGGLVLRLVLGKRKGLDHEDLHPHNLTLTALGTALLWFGWLGLDVGQARGANAAAAAAFVATILGRLRAASWAGRALEYFQKRKVTMLGACTGAIAGTGRGDAGGRLCHAGRGARPRGLGMPVLLRGDPGQGKAGLRRLARRLRRPRRRRPGRRIGSGRGGDARPSRRRGGLFNGNADLLFAQAIAVVAVAVYTVVVTVAILVLLDRVLGLRVSPEEEDLGLDLTQHGQRGYMMGEGELIGIDPK